MTIFSDKKFLYKHTGILKEIKFMVMNISSASSAVAARQTTTNRQIAKTNYSHSRTLYTTKKKEAYNKGKMLADVLDKCESTEKFQTMNLIESVRRKTVMPFLKGYEDNKGWFDKGFFTELLSKEKYSSRHNLIRFVANQLEDFFREEGCFEEYNKVREILHKRGNGKPFTEADAKVLDKVVKTAIDYAY